MSRTRRELLSQNFLWNRELVSKLIRGSSISRKDHVLEIGPGTGIITEQLLDVCGKLTAVEADRKLLSALQKKFPNFPHLSLHEGNFLAHPLPESQPFKVFSNIPFSITGDIFKKLLFAKNPPSDSYLVMQTEAANKFVADDRQNTMLAILAYPFFEISLVHEFVRSDFKPRPGVDSVLVRMRKRLPPLIGFSSLALYRDYVVYHFTRNRAAKRRTPGGWLAEFKAFVKEDGQQTYNRTRGSFEKWRVEERELSKIHRTRTDKNWKDV